MEILKKYIGYLVIIYFLVMGGLLLISEIKPEILSHTQDEIFLFLFVSTFLGFIAYIILALPAAEPQRRFKPEDVFKTFGKYKDYEYPYYEKKTTTITWNKDPKTGKKLEELTPEEVLQCEVVIDDIKKYFESIKNTRR